MLEPIPKQMPEHEQTQDMLSESKGYLKSLFDSIKTGIVVIDPDSHTIVDANPTVLKMVGAEKEHLLGRLCHQYICPAEIGKCPITDLKQTVDVSERILINSKGEHIPVLKSVIPVNGNNRTYLIESIHDISDRKRMEEALRKSEEEERQLAQENSAMAKLGRLLSSTLEIDEVYERFAEEVRGIIPFDRLAITIVNYQNQTLFNAYVAGQEVQERGKSEIFPLAGTLTEMMIRRKSVLLVQKGTNEEVLSLSPVISRLGRPVFSHT